MEFHFSFLHGMSSLLSMLKVLGTNLDVACTSNGLAMHQAVPSKFCFG